MIQPWTATCVQVLNHTVNHANNRAEVLDIVHRSLDRWEILILGRSGAKKPVSKYRALKLSDCRKLPSSIVFL